MKQIIITLIISLSLLSCKKQKDNSDSNKRIKFIEKYSGSEMACYIIKIDSVEYVACYNVGIYPLVKK